MKARIERRKNQKKTRLKPEEFFKEEFFDELVLVLETADEKKLNSFIRAKQAQFPDFKQELSFLANFAKNYQLGIRSIKVEKLFFMIILGTDTQVKQFLLKEQKASQAAKSLDPTMADTFLELINAVYNPQFKDIFTEYRGYTPLMLATSELKLEIVRALVSFGANIQQLSNIEKTDINTQASINILNVSVTILAGILTDGISLLDFFVRQNGDVNSKCNMSLPPNGQEATVLSQNLNVENEEIVDYLFNQTFQKIKNVKLSTQLGSNHYQFTAYIAFATGNKNLVIKVIKYFQLDLNDVALITEQTQSYLGALVEFFDWPDIVAIFAACHLNLRDYRSLPTWAAYFGKREFLKECVKLGFSLEQEGDDNTQALGVTPLCAAAFAGHFNIVIDLVLTHKVNMNQVLTKGKLKDFTALSVSTSCGHEQISQFLLRNGAALIVFSREPEKCVQPLPLAVTVGSEKMVQLYLAAGNTTEEKITDSEVYVRHLAYCIALDLNHQTIAALIKQKGIYPRRVYQNPLLSSVPGYSTSTQLTLLGQAYLYNRVPVLTAVCQLDLDINQPFTANKYGQMNVLLHACIDNKPDIAEYVLARGCCFPQQDFEPIFERLFQIASVKIIDLMIRQGVSPNRLIQTRWGNISPLLHSMLQHNSRKMALLLQHGADAQFMIPSGEYQGIDAWMLAFLFTQSNPELLFVLLQHQGFNQPELIQLIRQGTDPLCAAIIAGVRTFFDLMLRKEYDVNIASVAGPYVGLSPLQLTRQFQTDKTWQDALIAAGALDAKNEGQIIEKYGQTSTVEALNQFSIHQNVDAEPAASASAEVIVLDSQDTLAKFVRMHWDNILQLLDDIEADIQAEPKNCEQPLKITYGFRLYYHTLRLFECLAQQAHQQPNDAILCLPIAVKLRHLLRYNYPHQDMRQVLQFIKDCKIYFIQLLQDAKNELTNRNRLENHLKTHPFYKQELIKIELNEISLLEMIKPCLELIYQLSANIKTLRMFHLDIETVFACKTALTVMGNYFHAYKPQKDVHDLVQYLNSLGIQPSFSDSFLIFMYRCKEVRNRVGHEFSVDEFKSQTLAQLQNDGVSVNNVFNLSIKSRRSYLLLYPKTNNILVLTQKVKIN